MVSMENVPKNQPLMFLPNHQNGLMDPLILAAFSNRKPYFLTRSDVFVNPLLNALFQFLRMVPIYRIRDGRNTLQRNEAIFEACAHLLNDNKAIVIFPEGNHHIRKFVRPLSKGFTRILNKAREKNDALDIILIPVGINYQHAERFPDRVKFIFDAPVSLKEIVDGIAWNAAVPVIKDRIYTRLITLTAHISPEEDYDEILEYLERTGADFLDPTEVNKRIAEYRALHQKPVQEKKNPPLRFADFIFLMVNLPALLPWKLFFKRRVKEIEFLSTYRFAYALVAFPTYYLIVFLIVMRHGLLEAIMVTALLILHNFLYVKLR